CRSREVARSQALLGELERPPQDRALREHFLVLRVRDAVRDDAAARLETVPVAVEHHRADRDRLVHVAVLREVTDRATVEPARDGLELRDQLHRAHLRAPTRLAAGNAAAKRANDSLPGERSPCTPLPMCATWL